MPSPQTIAYACVALAGLLPYLATAIAKLGAKDFNNGNPREWLEKQEGYRRRAHSAQQNGFESYPFFAAAVVVAVPRILATNPVKVETVAHLAFAYVVLRLLYLAIFLANKATLRSVVWLLSMLCASGIWYLGLRV